MDMQIWNIRSLHLNLLFGIFLYVLAVARIIILEKSLHVCFSSYYVQHKKRRRNLLNLSYAIFCEFENMLGKRSSQHILTRKKDNKKQQQHTFGPNAIVIKITAIEHDIISGHELISIGIVEISSQKEDWMCSEKADRYLTALIFQDVLRRLYKV